MERPASLLHDLAHELRDALSPVRAAIDLMRIRGDDPQLRLTLLERIDRGLDAALAVLDASITAEQWDSGRAKPAAITMRLVELLRTVHAALPEPLQRRCTLAHRQSPVSVLADPASSGQVIVAMLEHAAVAAADAPITVYVSEDDAHGAIHAAFSRAPHAAIGEQWFADHRARGGGSRLSLRTARRIMQSQRGSLALADGEGAHCELVARWPRHGVATAPSAGAVAATGVAAAATEHAARGAAVTRVVLVEDSAEVRRAYREGLVAFGYEVTESRNAEEALQATAGALPDVVLIDIHLPGMNGYQLASAIRSRSLGRTRLVMLSGMTLDDTVVSLAKRAGFDDCFDKAAGPKALHALLRARL